MAVVKDAIRTKYSVRGKLLSAILITSSAVTLVLTCIQLGNDYRTDLSYIQKRMNEIRIGRAATLSQALWQLDTTLIETGLEGLLSVQDVIYAEITDKPEEKIEIGAGAYKRGKYESKEAIVFTEPLYHTVEATEETSTLKAGQKILLGNLNVVFTKNLIYDRLENKAILILGTQAIKTFVVSFLIMIFIRVLVTQHLSTMSTYFNKFNINNLNEPLKLNKKPFNADPNNYTGDEFDKVSEAINQMIEKVRENYDLQKQHQERLQELNLSLDQRVKEQTAQLAEEKRQMTMLLDNMSQAVFRIGQDYKIISPISKYASFIFGGSIEGKQVLDLIYAKSHNDKNLSESIHNVLTLCFGEDSLQWDMNYHNLPEKIQMTETGQVLKLSYSPLYNGSDQLSQILFVVEDVTNIQKLEEQRVKTSKQIAIMQAFAAANKRDIMTFFFASERQLNTVQKIFRDNPNVESLVACYRELHTLKGNARMLKFDEIGRVTHNVETTLSEVLNFLRAGNALNHEHHQKILQCSEELRNAVVEVANIGANFFSLNLSLADKVKNVGANQLSIEVLRSSFEHLKGVIEKLKSKSKFPEILEISDAVEQLSYVSMNDLVDKLHPMVEEIAGRLGKSVRIESAGVETLISPQHFEMLLNALVHMVRNSIDHGIESAADRTRMGKNSTGVVKVEWSVNSLKNLVIIVSDDGRGIDKSRVFTKAVQMGLVSAQDKISDHEIINFIFHPTLSTAEHVSDLSGRGVGMDVVAKMIKDLSGTIDVQTKVGEWTNFTIKLKIKTMVSESSALKEIAA